MSNKVYKGEKGEKFVLHTYEIGRYGGGTQPPEYRDKDGNIIPFEKTNWFKLKCKKAYAKFTGNSR